MLTCITKWAPLHVRMCRAIVAVSIGALAVHNQATAQTILLKDSFGFYPVTPAGGTRFDAAGNFVGITLHSDLSGLRAEFPFNSSEVWTGPGAHGGHGVDTWGFSVSSADPYEQYGTPSEPTPADNGTMTLIGSLPIQGADELLDFVPPGGAFQMSLDVVSGGLTTAIGFTSSSTVVNNNFPAFGQLWMVLHGGGGQGGIGTWELHTNGLSGPSVSGTTVLGGYNPLAISYDPATHTVRGSINGVLTPPISYTAAGITAVGFEGMWTVNNFIVRTGSLEPSTGSPFCPGDGNGTPCPCGNNSPVGGNAGCLNSLGSGGLLTASGLPSITSDTFILHGSGMPGSSALYFQGTVQDGAGAGVIFGDGLRCASGTIIRLGTKTNAAGSSQYPVIGDAPISVRGADAAGNVRTYQCWYRNAAAFCQPETFNLTNGWQATWLP
jgi:hypothetical protein